MKILFDEEERCSELEEMLSKLDDIKQDSVSEDIIEDITDLIIKYTSEFEEVNDRLIKKQKQEMKFENLEYEKSVWAG